MYVKRYLKIEDYLAELQSFLVENETSNTLILGVAMRLKEDIYAYESEPRMLGVFNDNIPVLAVLQTPPWNILVSTIGEEGDEVWSLLAGELAGDVVATPGVTGPSSPAQSFSKAWTELTGEETGDSMRIRAYELREVIPPACPAKGYLRPAEMEELALVTSWREAFHREAMPNEPLRDIEKAVKDQIMDGSLFVWVDDVPVSTAIKTRPTVNSISVSAVYTPHEYRNRGYASSCVAAVSQLLLDAGYSFCGLFTDLSNPTSNDIYMQIGYRSVCDFLNQRFIKSA